MRLVTMLIAVSAFLGSAAHSPAQIVSTGIITGELRDPSGAAVPQAIVMVAGDALIGGPQRALVSSDGTFRAAALPPGTYVLTATWDGFQPVRREGLILLPGATLVVDMTFAIAGVRENIAVQVRSPMVDVRSASVPAHLDETFLRHLPTSRDVASLINLAPGVAADVSFGGSQRSNALFVDGVATTEPLLQEPNTRFNHNWIQETQIVALGAGAEYGGFTGVASNSILRSGSNRLSGMAEYWTIRPSWLGRNTSDLSEQLQRDFAPRRITSWWETNGYVGGPVTIDRLWYFGGAQFLRHDDRPAGFIGPGSRDDTDWQAIVKPTVALSPSLRLDAFLERGIVSVNGENIDAFTPIESSHDTERAQTTWNTQLTRVASGGGLLELRHSGYDTMWRMDPHAPNTRSGPVAQLDTATGHISRNALVYHDQKTRAHTSSATYSHFVPQWRGMHDFKTGIEHEFTTADTFSGLPGGRTVYTDDGAPWATRLWNGARYAADTNRVSLFAQDTWSIARRLTVSPGVRLDANRGSVPGRQVFSTTPVSLRFGAAWDVTPDHRTVVRAHYGRYHDAIFSSRITEADTGGSSPDTFALLLETVVVPLSETKAAPLTIDPGLDHSHVDQYVVGIERELTTDFSVTAQFIARNFDNFMGLVDTGSAYQAVERRDPGADGRAGTSDDGPTFRAFNLTNPGARVLTYTNPDDAYNRYRAVQIVGRQRSGGIWQMQASYTWSRNEGTVGNRYHVNAARFDLGAPPGGRFSDPNWFINADGRAHFDPTHEGKVLGVARLPYWGGVNASGVYRYTTGQAWGRRIRATGFRQGVEVIRMEPVGTRRLPAIHRLDLRAEKTLRVSNGRTLGVFIEAFNLGNQGVPDSDRTNPIDDVSGPNFGTPWEWTDPRTVRAAIRFAF